MNASESIKQKIAELKEDLAWDVKKLSAEESLSVIDELKQLTVKVEVNYLEKLKEER